LHPINKIMAITSLTEFKKFVVDLLTEIVRRGDSKAVELKAQVDKLSSDLTIANETNQQLQAALIAKDEAAIAALAAQSAEEIAALDAFSTEVAANFYPTPTADAVSLAVEASPVVETPVEVTEATTLETAEPTPEEVTASAIEAIAEVAETTDFTEAA
jgi:hypothetical protein